MLSLKAEHIWMSPNVPYLGEYKTEQELDDAYESIINQEYSDEMLSSRANAELWGEVTDAWKIGEITSHDRLMDYIISRAEALNGQYPQEDRDY